MDIIQNILSVILESARSKGKAKAESDQMPSSESLDPLHMVMASVILGLVGVAMVMG